MIAQDNAITQPPKKLRRLTKLRETDFTIPIFSEYEKFNNVNYPVSFLKQICKNYKLVS